MTPAMKAARALEIEQHFGEHAAHVQIVKSPPSGEDHPDDLAQAWLDGNEKRYAELLGKELRRRAELVITSPIRRRDRSHRCRGRGVRSWNRARRVVDWGRVLEMRRQGMNGVDIARAIGCGKSQVYRICSKTRSTARSITRHTNLESKQSTSASASDSTSDARSSTFSGESSSTSLLSPT